jgi:hypothetical protein
MLGDLDGGHRRFRRDEEIDPEVLSTVSDLLERLGREDADSDQVVRELEANLRSVPDLG